ncbi:MAG TPA: cupredoxin family copper-binding protein [Methylocella sp.]|nr:cupredoxin family copper-binding protein [Methylocella sp.]
MRNLTKRHRSSGWRRCRALFIAAALAAVSTLPIRAADKEVNIDNFAFTPKELTVKAGTTIVFRNRDDIPHSVVGSTGEFHSKALDTDDSFSFTFAKAGSYAYSCGLHPRMWGRIVVTP